GATLADELPTSPTASSVPPQKAASSLSAMGSATKGSGTSCKEGATTADTATGFSTPPPSEGGASTQSEPKFETGPPTSTTTSKGGSEDGITVGATSLRGSSSACPPKAGGLSASSPPPNTVTRETAGDEGGSVGVGASRDARR